MRRIIFTLLLILSPSMGRSNLGYAQSSDTGSKGASQTRANPAQGSSGTSTQITADTSIRQEPVVVIEIAGEVDLGMASYVERSIQHAEQIHAVILLHVNTFGGRIDAATRIRDAVLHAKVPQTIAFIDRRAISAGALISLAAKKIVMSTGSTFGAATPVNGQGEKASEKVNSYMRAEMRATAESNHRDGKIAQAMVDESLGLDTINGIALEHGRLLTLTKDDAKKVGYSDAEASSIEEALTVSGIKAKGMERAEEGLGDSLVRFLTSGIVSSILIMLGVGGLFYSLKTGHFGGITLIGIGALVLFFGGQYVTSVAPVLAIVVFIAGMALLLIELSPVPSFGFAGVLGVMGIWLGLFFALAGDMRTLTPSRLSEVLWTLAASLVGVIVLASLIIRYAPKATWLKKFSNQSFSGDTSSFAIDRNHMIGMAGIAHTMLRPAGTALFEGRKFDVMTRGEFVQPGADIVVTSVSNNKVIVRSSNELPADDAAISEHGDSYGGKL